MAATNLSIAFMQAMSDTRDTGHAGGDCVGNACLLGPAWQGVAALGVAGIHTATQLGTSPSCLPAADRPVFEPLREQPWMTLMHDAA